jgi:hypothetical protein
MRKRKERADRSVRLLTAIDSVPELGESAYGWLSLTSETMKKSKATASRDLALARRIRGQFARMFGRSFDPRQDSVKWSWKWSHYGFRTRESIQSGYQKPLGQFSFSTRSITNKAEYCGLGPTSWQSVARIDLGALSTRDLISSLRLLNRFK